jgi:molecular chaperone GrpE
VIDENALSTDGMAERRSKSMTPKKGKTKKTRETAAKTGGKKKAGGKDPERADSDKGADDLENLRSERDEFRDRLQRTAADFSNYQKRSHRELEETRKYAASGLALDMIGVVDNFQRALEAAEGKMDEDFLKGFRMIEEQLLGMLAKHGIEPIEAVGKPFDPNFHDALLEAEDPDLPDKTVKDELERGYMIHDRLLRPTKVRVSRVPASADEGENAKNIEESSLKDKKAR